MVQVGPLLDVLSSFLHYSSCPLKACSFGVSQLFILTLELLTVSYCSDITGDCISAVYHPHTEEISSQLHAAMFHSQIEGVCRATSYSLAFCFKPLQGVKFSLPFMIL